MYDTSQADAYANYLTHVSRATNTTYSDGIDKRIDRLQKREDVALSYSDFKIKRCTADNKTVDYGDTATFKCSVDSNYNMISPAGVSVTNATTDGSGISRIKVDHLAMGDAIKGSTTYPNTNGYVRATPCKNNYTSKIKFEYDFLEHKELTARTTTFTPSSPKGKARYSALKALNDAKSSHFPASYIKMATVDTGSCGTLNDWTENCANTKTLSITSGAILGVVGWASYNDPDYSSATGMSYALITRARLATNTIGTSKTVSTNYYVGNSTYNDSTAATMTRVGMKAYVRYISSGTYTVSNS
jgi:hypothetical protein